MDWEIAIGVAGIIVGILASYVFYKRGDKQKDLCWAIRTNNLISDYSSTLSGLRVEYQDEEVANLSVSNVVVWNNGREVIDERDLDTGINHHLSLVAIGDARILNVERLEDNNPANAVQMLPGVDQRSALVNFRYLGHNHGTVFQVVHTGRSSEGLELEGEVRGINTITRSRDVRPHDLRIAGQWESLGAGILFFASAIFAVFTDYAVMLVVAGIGIAYLVSTRLIELIRWRRRRLPAGLDSFFQITSDFNW